MKRHLRTLSGPERTERVVELLALRLLDLASRGLLEPDSDDAVPASTPTATRAQEAGHGAR
jgi:hypothetical protein